MVSTSWTPRRILAIKNKHLGDVLCGVPAFRALSESFPLAELDVIVSPGSRDLIAGFDWIGAVIESPRKLRGFNRVRDEWRVARAVASGGYDLVVDFTWSDRAMWYALLSRARLRWAIQVTAGSKLKPHVFHDYGGKPDRSHHVMEHEREFLVRMGLPHYDIRPDFPPTPSEEQEARDWLASQNVQRDKLVVVHPTSRWLFKCWHDERVAEVIDWLAAQGWQPVVTCGPSADELKRARKIVSLVRQPCLSRLGDMSLRQLAAFMRQAQFFFGMDSAPSHMASAVGLPAVVLFGPSQVKRWRPFGEAHAILHQECPCIVVRGAELACDKTQIVRCMSAITVDQVTSTIQSRFHLAA
jgi:heptosyltransferase-3